MKTKKSSHSRIFAITLTFLAIATGGTFAAPPSDIVTSPAPPALQLNAASGTVAATLTSIDPDPADTHTYTLVNGIGTTPIMAAGSTWKYYDQPNVPAANWQTAAYSDAAWLSGPAALGYGETNPFPTEVSALTRTVYFRKTVTLTDVATISQLNFGVQRDDGAIVYINGVEAFRQNMPAGAVVHGTFSTAGTTSETTFFPTNVTALAPFNLVNGANLIAVEVHQNSAGSTDIRFDMTLNAIDRTNPLDNASFTIVSNQLRSAVLNAKPEGGTYTVRVRSQDAALEAREEEFTVLSTANTAPSATDVTFSVNEGDSVHKVVGTIFAFDVNGVTYAITGGNTGAAFAIHPETGEIKVDEPLPLGIDAELTPSFSLIVSITDGHPTAPLTKNIIVTINVINLDESPVFAATTPKAVQSMAVANTLVATTAATDPEGATITYSITSGNTGTAFKIDATTGEITVNSPAALNPAVNPEFNLQITATDGTSTPTTLIQHISVANILVATNATARYHVPASSADDFTWYTSGFVDSSWTLGTSGFGYDAPGADPNFTAFFSTDVGAIMQGISSSLFIRYPFTVTDRNKVGDLNLNMTYEDGFIAYINGIEVARRTAPAPATPITWLSAASGNRNEALVFTPEVINISAFRSAIVNGANVLAIRGLNSGPGSSDFVIQAELTSTAYGSPSSPLTAQITLAPVEAITQTSVRLPVNVTSTGGSAPALTLYYGKTNGGETPGNWGSNLPLGTLATGNYTPLLTTLSAGTQYYYAVRAVNTAGTSWVAGTPFSTLATGTVNESILVAEGAGVKYRVPTTATEDATWFSPIFSDVAWTAGNLGVGYDTGAGYTPYIQSDVRNLMEDRETSVYVRIPFNAATTAFDRLRLQARYDDGFVAYLNGTEILRVNTPVGPLNFETSSENGLHEAGAAYDSFDVTNAAKPLLVSGANILAIHAVNLSMGSTDMLIDVRLLGDELVTANNFTLPTLTSLAPVGITANSATTSGIIGDLGGSASVQVVFLYGKTNAGTNPLLWENRVSLNSLGVGAFNAPLTGLTAATNYFYNFYAYNEKGLVWATTKSFFTAGIQPPTVTTVAETPVNNARVQLNGTLDAHGGDPNTSVFFAYGFTDGGASLAAWESQFGLGVTVVGNVAATLNNIPPNSTMFYRVFATNTAGTSSGVTETFSTLAVAPALTLNAASSITTTAATLSGTLTEDGGDTTEVILYYGTTDEGVIAGNWQNSVSLGNSAEGAITTALAGLTPSQQYFFTASATNSIGTTWAPFSRMFFAGQSVIVDAGANASYLVPVDNSQDTTWYASAFDDSLWATGPTGVGFDTAVTYAALIGSNIITEMNDGNKTSAFIRIDFNVADKSLIKGLILNMKHDDGFVAYLNGTEISRDRVIGATPLAFNANASGNREDALLNEYEAFDISASIGLLVNGNNVLAIHGFNSSAASSDFVMLPQIITLASPIPSANDYASWVADYPSLTGPDALITADPDLDGIINLLEYAFGGNPAIPGGLAGGAPLLPRPAVTTNVGSKYFEITYRRRIDAAARNITYTVETSANMATGTWTDATANFAQQGAATAAGDGLTEFVTLRSIAAIGPNLKFGRVSVSAN